MDTQNLQPYHQFGGKLQLYAVMKIILIIIGFMYGLILAGRINQLARSISSPAHLLRELRSLITSIRTFGIIVNTLEFLLLILILYGVMQVLRSDAVLNHQFSNQQKVLILLMLAYIGRVVLGYYLIAVMQDQITLLLEQQSVSYEDIENMLMHLPGQFAIAFYDLILGLLLLVFVMTLFDWKDHLEVYFQSQDLPPSKILSSMQDNLSTTRWGVFIQLFGLMIGLIPGTSVGDFFLVAGTAVFAYGFYQLGDNFARLKLPERITRQPISENTAFCPQCGKKVEHKTKFCIFCGISISASEQYSNDNAEWQ